MPSPIDLLREETRRAGLQFERAAAKVSYKQAREVLLPLGEMLRAINARLALVEQEIKLSAQVSDAADLALQLAREQKISSRCATCHGTGRMSVGPAASVPCAYCTGTGEDAPPKPSKRR